VAGIAFTGVPLLAGPVTAVVGKNPTLPAGNQVIWAVVSVVVSVLVALIVRGVVRYLTEGYRARQLADRAAGLQDEIATLRAALPRRPSRD